MDLDVDLAGLVPPATTFTHPDDAAVVALHEEGDRLLLALSVLDRRVGLTRAAADRAQRVLRARTEAAARAPSAAACVG